MLKIANISGIYANNISSKVFQKKEKQVFLRLKTLPVRDTVTFTSKVPINDPYEHINSVADEYLSHLKISIEAGLKFLKSRVKNLSVGFDSFCDGRAGVADIVPGKKPGSIMYEIKLDNNNSKVFDSALHEGYHILQFDNDTKEEFIKIKKQLAAKAFKNQELQKRYDKLTATVINDIFLPVFVKNRKIIRKQILETLKRGNYKQIQNIQSGNIINPEKKLLPDYLENWFAKLSDDCLKYVISHARIEVKAHSYCMGKDETPLIYNRNSINMSKVRDILAIHLYKEIISMAEVELLSRKKC